MPGLLKGIAAVSFGLTSILVIIYIRLQTEPVLSLAVTFGTISYHFCIRLLIGLLYQVFMQNHADYRRKWYRTKQWEQKLYRIMRVKSWKRKLPTYDAGRFDPSVRSWDEIAQAMCQSELVHETNVIFSFLPLMACIWFGAFPVFLITSILAACFDLIFVVIQRYNRTRILRMMDGRQPS